MNKQNQQPIPVEIRDRINKGWLVLQIGYMFQRTGMNLVEGTSLYRMNVKNLCQKLDQALAQQQNLMDDYTRQYVETTQAIFARLVDQLYQADETQLNHVIQVIDDLVNGQILIVENSEFAALEAQLEPRPEDADPGVQMPDQDLPPVATKKRTPRKKKVVSHAD